MTSKVLYELLIRRYERFMYSSQMKVDDFQKHQHKPKIKTLRIIEFHMQKELEKKT